MLNTRLAVCAARICITAACLSWTVIIAAQDAEARRVRHRQSSPSVSETPEEAECSRQYREVTGKKYHIKDYEKQFDKVIDDGFTNGYNALIVDLNGIADSYRKDCSYSLYEALALPELSKEKVIANRKVLLVAREEDVKAQQERWAWGGSGYGKLSDWWLVALGITGVISRLGRPIHRQFGIETRPRESCWRSCPRVFITAIIASLPLILGLSWANFNDNKDVVLLCILPLVVVWLIVILAFVFVGLAAWQEHRDNFSIAPEGTKRAQ